jgi:hypothetical protein
MLRALLLLSLSLAAGCAAVRGPEGRSDAPAGARFAPLSDEAAWKRLSRETPPLPIWARTLVDSLPRTTALQLDLDFLHRTKNPLGTVLAGRLRWAVADANQCAYARASAESDLAQAGLTADQLRRLGDADSLSESERVAIEFARKLTWNGAAITDGEVADLIDVYGPDDAVAIVHTVAHANFQNRIFLALGAVAEPDGPFPPREVRPTADTSYAVPARPALAAPSIVRSDTEHARPPWDERSFAQLRAELDRQKQRKPRIPKPDAVRLARLPRPDRERVAGTAWGKVSMGYQPVLTTAWFQTMGAFESEAKLDEVFANTVFWVVTRTNDCFY